jgi:hypothetical protein
MFLLSTATRAEIYKKKRCPDHLPKEEKRGESTQRSGKSNDSSLIYRPRAVARRSERIGETLSTSQGVKVIWS